MCFVSIGNSLPDIFTSMYAASDKKRTDADAAIGSFACANAANVFIGLGLPWTCMTIYEWTYNNQSYFIGALQTGDLTFALVLFMCASIICVAMLMFRRKKLGSELGGP